MGDTEEKARARSDGPPSSADCLHSPSQGKAQYSRKNVKSGVTFLNISYSVAGHALPPRRPGAVRVSSWPAGQFTP